MSLFRGHLEKVNEKAVGDLATPLPILWDAEPSKI